MSHLVNKPHTFPTLGDKKPVRMGTRTVWDTFAVWLFALLVIGSEKSPGAQFEFIPIDNPTPEVADYFGASVAGIGTDKILVGAYEDKTGAREAGAAYLFSTDGALLTAFTNPFPARFDWFGTSVASCGRDRVLIGAPGMDNGTSEAGVAYLLDLDGTVLTVITNPAPWHATQFGLTAAALGSDRILVGAQGSGTGAAVFLFNTNGGLLTAFTNPVSSGSDAFGSRVAAVGSEHLVIGAYRSDIGASNSGAAYLFAADGTLLTTFTNPAPSASAFFGYSVAGITPDKVLIGAYQGDAGATDAGAAYLFNTNGLLLTIFTNPTPAAYEYFGRSVAAVGNDRVLIGAHYESSGGPITGAAYLFNLDGTLLGTLTNSAPEPGDRLGGAVAAAGIHTLVAGAYGHGNYTGAAYLFRVPGTFPSHLSIERVGNGVRLSWPAVASNFILEESPDFTETNAWTVVPVPYQTNSSRISAVVPVDRAGFYRLRKL